MITPENLARHELTGLEAEVAESANKSQVGSRGIVTDETRQTLTIDTEHGEKSFAKDQCVFLFTLPGGEKVKVSGKVLVSRPEDRIKKKMRRW